MTVDRTALLYSEAKTAAFRQKKIVLVGLGGVGLYALENLARAGIKRFVLIDGDGAVVMHMGSLLVAAETAPKNLIHFVINNYI